MTKVKKEFDIWKDYHFIETLDCPYCGKSKLKFRKATGYESHFRDSDFICRKCCRTYSIMTFFGCDTKKEVQEKLEIMGDAWRFTLDRTLEERKRAYDGLLEIKKMDKKFNPSKRVG